MSKQEEIKLDESDFQLLAGLLVMSYERFPEDERPQIGKLIAKLAKMSKELKENE